MQTTHTAQPQPTIPSTAAADALALSSGACPTKQSAACDTAPPSHSSPYSHSSQSAGTSEASGPETASSGAEAAPSQPAAQRPDHPQPSSTNPQPPRKAGRPNTFNDYSIAAIVSLIDEYGLSDTAAAARVGIPAATLSRWKYLQPGLETRFDAAREGFRIRQLQEIQRARTRDGRPDWRAAAWLLERIFPADYARRPGRRVDPAPEHSTWLDAARARATSDADCLARAEFERNCHEAEVAAQTAAGQRAWHDAADLEPVSALNLDQLFTSPVNAEFNCPKSSGPAGALSHSEPQPAEAQQALAVPPNCTSAPTIPAASTRQRSPDPTAISAHSASPQLTTSAASFQNYRNPPILPAAERTNALAELIALRNTPRHLRNATRQPLTTQIHPDAATAAVA